MAAGPGGLKVSAIASPIGNVDISLPVEYEVRHRRQIITGKVVPASEGDGELDATIAALKADSFAGSASLEPPPVQRVPTGWFSGPIAFGVAARTLGRLAAGNGATLS